MRNMYNLGTVVKFEIVRMLKKFSFKNKTSRQPLLTTQAWSIHSWLSR